MQTSDQIFPSTTTVKVIVTASIHVSMNPTPIVGPVIGHNSTSISSHTITGGSFIGHDSTNIAHPIPTIGPAIGNNSTDITSATLTVTKYTGAGTAYQVGSGILAVVGAAVAGMML
ncbi:hypothetical protein M501DRAFT_994406 [Patellaria atrata CBS 101060]|uniref:Uncharacterized protein n=1 Tax=Patellaria atrata CBS 101060 TaxID=1346257 RepID=A0A9P4SKE5_9PEZI|nr:hypothetical protein M501DRAFT_994406 [Patellaria atrata CBS 101060]